MSVGRYLCQTTMFCTKRLNLKCNRNLVSNLRMQIAFYLAHNTCVRHKQHAQGHVQSRHEKPLLRGLPGPQPGKQTKGIPKGMPGGGAKPQEPTGQGEGRSWSALWPAYRVGLHPQPVFPLPRECNPENIRILLAVLARRSSGQMRQSTKQLEYFRLLRAIGTPIPLRDIAQISPCPIIAHPRKLSFPCL